MNRAVVDRRIASPPSRGSFEGLQVPSPGRRRDDPAPPDQRAARVLDLVADAYLLLDTALVVQTANQAAVRALGVPRERIVGRPLWEVAPAHWVESPAREEIDSVMSGRAETHLTVRGPRGGDGDDDAQQQASDIDAYAAPDGGVALFWRDVSDRVSLADHQRVFAAQLLAWNQQLQASAAEQARLLGIAEAMRAEAEAANKAKTDFLTVMSHELRTPLNAIGGYTELLELGLRGPLTPEQRTDLGRIQRNQQHLLGLINALLNFARLEAGELTYDFSDVVIPDAISAAVSLIGGQVEARQLTLRTDECGRDLLAHTDAEKLQQVLLNLLSNAIKFTPAGGVITVRCARHEDVVTIAVADTGVGIPERQLAHIFEPFVQVDTSLSRAAGGVGLGLSISASLVRGLGGTLQVESAVGSGSTFTLSLPVVRIHTPDALL